MGTVVAFPGERRPAVLRQARPAAPGTVVILPVIRIERALEDPSDQGGDGASDGKKGKRRPQEQR